MNVICHVKDCGYNKDYACQRDEIVIFPIDKGMSCANCIPLKEFERHKESLEREYPAS